MTALQQLESQIPSQRIPPVLIQKSENDEMSEMFSLVQQTPLVLSSDSRINAIAAKREEFLRLALYRVAQQDLDQKRYKYPIRLSKASRGAVNAYGDYLYQMLQLCRVMHSQTPPGLYQNAAHWFVELIGEWRSTKNESLMNFRLKKGKQALADLIQEDLIRLKGFKSRDSEDLKDRDPENPENKQTAPHRWLLLELSLKHSDRNSEFQKKYWKPYLAALVAWKNELKSNPSLESCYCNDGDFFVQKGRGKASVHLFKNRSPKTALRKA